MCSEKDVNEIGNDNYDLVGDIEKQLQLDTFVNEIPSNNEDLNFELTVPEPKKTVGFQDKTNVSTGSRGSGRSRRETLKKLQSVAVERTPSLLKVTGTKSKDEGI